MLPLFIAVLAAAPIFLSDEPKKPKPPPEPHVLVVKIECWRSPYWRGVTCDTTYTLIHPDGEKAKK